MQESQAAPSVCMPPAGSGGGGAGAVAVTSGPAGAVAVTSACCCACCCSALGMRGSSTRTPFFSASATSSSCTTVSKRAGPLAAGATGVGVELDERERWIASQVGPIVRDKGLLFVGLDVIGDRLTEINVTSPTCIRELDAEYGLNIAGQMFDALEALRES